MQQFKREDGHFSGLDRPAVERAFVDSDLSPEDVMELTREVEVARMKVLERRKYIKRHDALIHWCAKIGNGSHATVAESAIISLLVMLVEKP